VTAADPPPAGPLPEGVSPEHYRLALTVDPASERFSGEVWIRVRLDAPTQRVWMHGGAMTVSSSTVSRPGVEAAVPATWTTSVERPEIAALRFAQPEGPGVVELHLVFDAPFGRQLAGLYRVDVGADHYAFTQFESTSARLAFPGFDEPRWKTPFDVELTVRQDDVAIANTREVESTPVEGGLRRVRFATTEPLPTYLLAMAVGPLDVIEAAPIAANAVRPNALPFRGIAARGRGPELRHALAHTPDLLAALEAYTGTAYPYDKLDIIAVPDFASGAMENAGAITFREQLLLLGEQPPEDQVRSFTGVMAHELAHQWFGNLVTMAWWDGLWLNEGFAAFMEHFCVDALYPEYRIWEQVSTARHVTTYSHHVHPPHRLRFSLSVVVVVVSTRRTPSARRSAWTACAPRIPSSCPSGTPRRSSRSAHTHGHTQTHRHMD
jgi:alanyl aminopeptidase